MKSFLHGRAQTPSSLLQSLSPPIVSDSRLSSAKGHGHSPVLHTKDSESAPTIECVKQGDKVVGLIVTCSCGERIEIDCLYPGNG